MSYYKSIGQHCPRCGKQLDEGDTVLCLFGTSYIISCGGCATDDELVENAVYSGRDWFESFKIGGLHYV